MQLSYVLYGDCRVNTLRLSVQAERVTTRDGATAAAISTFIATTKLIVVEGITIIPIPDEANIWQQEVLSIKYVDDVAGEGMTMDTTVSEMQYLVHTTIVTKVNKRHWLEKQEHNIHVYIYNTVYIYGHHICSKGKDQPGEVANPARGQLVREN